MISIQNTQTNTIIISRRNRGFGGGASHKMHVPFQSRMHRSWAVYLHPHSGIYKSLLYTGSKHIIHSIIV